MQTLVGVAGYSATVKGVATRKSLGTADVTQHALVQDLFL